MTQTPLSSLTEEERKLIGFCLACYIEDAETKLRKMRKQGTGTPNEFAARLARVQRLTYTKIIPEALTGDDVLADGSILKKEMS